MFNGQYAKSAMHLIVFVILVALADNLYWAFWWLVWGWIFYQAFEAYHTARARRDHLPLPNPFGWNEVGEHMGFSQPVAHQAPPVPPPPETYARQAGANWAGYIPPRQTAAPPPAPAASSPNDNPYASSYAPPVPPCAPSSPGPTSVPYVPTYTGVSPQAPTISQPRITCSRRFPLGALWLIGLGVVFLTGNLLPSWRLSGRWFAPLLLAVLALWSAVRRWELAQAARVATGMPVNLASTMVGPAVLLTVSILLTLQSADILPMRRSWPVLLMIWGMMLLLQRSVATPLALPMQETTEAAPPPPVRSTAGTGSLGL